MEPAGSIVRTHSLTAQKKSPTQAAPIVRRTIGKVLGVR